MLVCIAPRAPAGSTVAMYAPVIPLTLLGKKRNKKGKKRTKKGKENK
jgi:hypothetical protein